MDASQSQTVNDQKSDFRSGSYRDRVFLVLRSRTVVDDKFLVAMVNENKCQLQEWFKDQLDPQTAAERLLRFWMTSQCDF